MKIAALYDIHGNAPALEAVLAALVDEKVDLIIIGGDIVAGPLPNEALDLLQMQMVPVEYLHGNGESEVNRYLATGEPRAITSAGAKMASWVGEHLTLDHQRMIASWPTIIEKDHPTHGRLLFCHATPFEDETIFTRNSRPGKVEEIFDRVAADVVICGHVHVQETWPVGDKQIVRAGSVGMPYGRTGAHWVLIDEEIELRHTPYDQEAAAVQIRASGHPGADEFVQNYVFSAPPLETALAQISAMEQNQEKGSR